MFSVAVVCYRNFEYIYDAILSVISQKNVDIELIVSDDGSPDFPYEHIVDYIDSVKGDNIKKVIVRCEEHNKGTVRHLNNIIDAASGDFICFLACDDVFAGSNVLAHYAKGFEKAGVGAYIEMAQTAMYDSSLRRMESYYLRPNTAKLLIDKDYDGLLRELLTTPCLPTVSTCYKKEFFKKYGNFDESYSLIEDVPLHLKIALERINIHYENFVAIKHRHGGISHGASAALSATKRKYYADCLQYKNVCERYCREYLHQSAASDYQLLKRIKREKLYYEKLLFWNEQRAGLKLYFARRHPFEVFLMFYDKFCRIFKIRYIVKICALVIGAVLIAPKAHKAILSITGCHMVAGSVDGIYVLGIYVLELAMFVGILLLPHRYIEKINACLSKFIYLRC